MSVTGELNRKRVVFLGTPQIVVPVLDKLLQQEKNVQVMAVVSQPPARSPRGGGVVYSPVHAFALEKGIPVLTPETARDPEFLETLKALKPALCVTAAYGNVLPDEFLAIPTFGTLNIHPSLLPLYRGAAPVQRSLEAGDPITGVTVAFTVKTMDAGPVLVQKQWPVDPDIKAPQLLAELFEVGANMLVDALPSVFSGRAKVQEQDHSKATKARKLSVEESLLNFSHGAWELHNKVRAFAGWPGARALLEIEGAPVEVKIVTTRAPKQSGIQQTELLESGSGVEKKFACQLKNDALSIPCDDGSQLEVLELQVPGKRVMSAKDFWNGLKNKSVQRK